MIYIFCLYHFSLKCIIKKYIYHWTIPLMSAAAPSLLDFAALLTYAVSGAPLFPSLCCSINVCGVGRHPPLDFAALLMYAVSDASPPSLDFVALLMYAESSSWQVATACLAAPFHLCNIFKLMLVDFTPLNWKASKPYYFFNITDGGQFHRYPLCG